MGHDGFIANVVAWAADQPEILAVVLVGSQARGEARPDSDIDLVIITAIPERFLEDTDWTRSFGTTGSITFEDWGRLKSVRVFYVRGPEVEFGITPPEWATDADEATISILRSGHRILLDRNGIIPAV